MFALASVPRTNPYALETIDSNGDLSIKEFTINEKIDPPIFEFEALKTAVGLLAQWKYRNEDDHSAGKKMLPSL